MLRVLVPVASPLSSVVDYSSHFLSNQENRGALRCKIRVEKLPLIAPWKKNSFGKRESFERRQFSREVTKRLLKSARARLNRSSCELEIIKDREGEGRFVGFIREGLFARKSVTFPEKPPEVIIIRDRGLSEAAGERDPQVQPLTSTSDVPRVSHRKRGIQQGDTWNNIENRNRRSDRQKEGERKRQ
jgi:hypothetical protein